MNLVSYNQGKTRVLSDDEVKEIQEKTSGIIDDEPENDYPEEKSGKYAYIYEDDDDDEDGGRFLNSRMEKIVNVLRILVLVIIVLIVIYIIGNFFGLIDFGFGKKKTPQENQQTEQQSGKVEMISLKGMTVEEAEDALAEMGLKVQMSTETESEEYEPGQIISQDVAEGAMVEEGTVIHVTVAAEPEAKEIEVPNVEGDSSETAMSTLEGKGFKVSREFKYDSSVATGKVISQSPSAGSKAKEGDTITIYVSQGKESAKVPSVTGKSKEDAERAIGDAGLNVGEITEEFSDTVAAGLVISQGTEAGKYVDKGTSISLVISKGTEKKTYYVKSKVTAPSNVTNVSADMVLYASESDEVLETWTGITTFPFTIEKHGIEEIGAGTLVITWHYTDADGNEGVKDQEAEITFREE